MAGFFGLFRSKTKYVDESTEVNDKTPRGDAFYLSDDEANSLGNPEFIRKSLKKKGSGTSGITESKASPTTTPSDRSRRSVDTNMDIFRKMAKDIKK